MVVGKVIMIVVILMVIAGTVIVSTNDYDLSTGKGRIGFAKAYFGWSGKIIKNLYSITTYAIKLDWIPR